MNLSCIMWVQLCQQPLLPQRSWQSLEQHLWQQYMDHKDDGKGGSLQELHLPCAVPVSRLLHCLLCFHKHFSWPLQKLGAPATWTQTKPQAVQKCPLSCLAGRAGSLHGLWQLVLPALSLTSLSHPAADELPEHACLATLVLLHSSEQAILISFLRLVGTASCQQHQMRGQFCQKLAADRKLAFAAPCESDCRTRCRERLAHAV